MRSRRMAAAWPPPVRAPAKIFQIVFVVFHNNCIFYLFHLKLFVIEPIKLHRSCTLDIFINDMIFTEYFGRERVTINDHLTCFFKSAMWNIFASGCNAVSLEPARSWSETNWVWELASAAILLSSTTISNQITYKITLETASHIPYKQLVRRIFAKAHYFGIRKF